ncbi:hypothetical protein EDB86DRAFT_3073928 [Lactarius hatsudake]|nr:hypothetical protein EDB86DRAFT_3073928 [Lactarius hatsudake]
MGWFDNHQAAKDYETYNNVEPHEHEAKLSHELISGAAAFEPKHIMIIARGTANHPPIPKPKKYWVAGLSGVAVDRLVETKGLNFIDKQKAKRRAEQHAEEKLAGEY